jgi:hypothetical protein
MMDEEYNFTELQKETIANLMVKCWGGHMQTGFDHDGEGYPVLWAQIGPNYAKVRFVINPDGFIQEGL